MKITCGSDKKKRGRKCLFDDGPTVTVAVRFSRSDLAKIEQHRQWLQRQSPFPWMKVTKSDAIRHLLMIGLGIAHGQVPAVS